MRLCTWIMSCLLALALGACATDTAKPSAAGKVTQQLRSDSTELRTYQIEEWIAPDDRTLILTTLDRSLIEARFKRQCSGLRLVDTVAFVVPANTPADQYPGIVLPDGRYCEFKSVTHLVTPEAPARAGSAE